MINVYPDYYTEFKCINKSCKHNCCIGWEIDIDNTTALKYNEFPGEFGNRLRANISKAPSRFKNLSNGRCPFLNKDNLCDIIINIGEEHLCEICKAHPRFINELPDRTEYGIGLSCEEAARIILTKASPVALICDGDTNTTDELLINRNKLFGILQNNTKPIAERVEDMLIECNTSLPQKSIEDWADTFLGYERLDEGWTDILHKLKDYSKANITDFEKYIKPREQEYEQLLVYLIYRYYANAFDLLDGALFVSFAALSYKLIYAIGAVIFTEHGSFSVEEQIELIRMFSAEIEYSDSIIDEILNELY